MRHVLLMLTILGCVVVFAGLGCEEDEGECRIYLVEDGSGEFDALHVVNSPNGEDGLQGRTDRRPQGRVRDLWQRVRVRGVRWFLRQW
ncbi:MAG: hypothetical protein JRF63_14030 [Deltaproteobacteria bacterium]|nr:hypothetical protein [Deltaproteobacteria bacterium]